MLQYAKIKDARLRDGKSEIVVISEDSRLYEYIISKRVKDTELRLDDGRRITALQRRKAYATIRDIALHTGYLPEEAKEVMKYHYIVKTGREYFSFSDCSIETARIFINVLIDYALREGIQVQGNLIDNTDDIHAYLACCVIHKKCCICGNTGEIHHEDTIGMGADREEVDDSDKKIICLCRKHHTLAHSLGKERFFNMYHVYGIVKKTVPLIYQKMYEEIR